MNSMWTKSLFLVAAAYDGILGIAYFLFFPQVFAYFQITPPNHPAYVQFPALLVLIFAWMFWRIAGDPVKNRDLIPFGMGLKVAYCGIVFWYAFRGAMWPAFVALAWIDAVFLALFILAWVATGRARLLAQQ
jgi:hypothetical protein